MNTLSQIQSELTALPANLQAEVLEGDSPFFRTLTEAGFVGCIETDEQLSTRYKGQIDFSDKAGTKP